MDSTDWLAVATSGAAVLGFIAAVISSRRDHRRIQDIHDKVGNGFASEVIDALGELQSGQDRQSIQIGSLTRRMDSHIRQHATR